MFVGQQVTQGAGLAARLAQAMAGEGDRLEVRPKGEEPGLAQRLGQGLGKQRAQPIDKARPLDLALVRVEVQQVRVRPQHQLFRRQLGDQMGDLPLQAQGRAAGPDHQLGHRGDVGDLFLPAVIGDIEARGAQGRQFLARPADGDHRAGLGQHLGQLLLGIGRIDVADQLQHRRLADRLVEAERTQIEDRPLGAGLLQALLGEAGAGLLHAAAKLGGWDANERQQHKAHHQPDIGLNLGRRVLDDQAQQLVDELGDGEDAGQAQDQRPPPGRLCLGHAGLVQRGQEGLVPGGTIGDPGLHGRVVAAQVVGADVVRGRQGRQGPDLMRQRQAEDGQVDQRLEPEGRPAAAPAPGGHQDELLQDAQAQHDAGAPAQGRAPRRQGEPGPDQEAVHGQVEQEIQPEQRVDAAAHQGEAAEGREQSRRGEDDHRAAKQQRSPVTHGPALNSPGQPNLSNAG